jgi:hypothetical protein
VRALLIHGLTKLDTRQLGSRLHGPDSVLVEDYYVTSCKSDWRLVETFLQPSELHVAVGGKREDYLIKWFFIPRNLEAEETLDSGHI